MSEPSSSPPTDPMTAMADVIIAGIDRMISDGQRCPYIKRRQQAWPTDVRVHADNKHVYASIDTDWVALIVAHEIVPMPAPTIAIADPHKDADAICESCGRPARSAELVTIHRPDPLYAHVPTEDREAMATLTDYRKVGPCCAPAEVTAR